MIDTTDQFVNTGRTLYIYVIILKKNLTFFTILYIFLRLVAFFQGPKHLA